MDKTGDGCELMKPDPNKPPKILSGLYNFLFGVSKKVNSIVNMDFFITTSENGVKGRYEDKLLIFFTDNFIKFI